MSICEQRWGQKDAFLQRSLTDNGKEFTNKVCGNNPTNKTHEFDELCFSLGIEHRLTKVRRPQTVAFHTIVNVFIEEGYGG